MGRVIEGTAMPINFDAFDLRPYANRYFVETGFFHGEGAMKALSSGLFDQGISVEVNDELVARGLERFRLMVATGMLRLVHDDSANLGKHICELQHPITFFLDAHGYWVQERRVACTAETPVTAAAAEAPTDEGNAEAETGCLQQHDSPCPLLEELEAIRQHPLARQHTVLIDDRRCMRPGFDHPTQNWWHGLSEEVVLDKLRQINPEFRIFYVDGLVPDDIIVALPP